MFSFPNDLDAGHCGGYEVDIVDDGLQNFEAVCLFLTAIYKIYNLFFLYLCSNYCRVTQQKATQSGREEL